MHNTNDNTFLIVGGGGRESAIALKLAHEITLYAVLSHENPSILDCVRQSGGEYLIADSNDPEIVLKFAQKHSIDYVFISADDPLANGAIDTLLKHNIKAIGGTKAATRIEWDKVYAMEMMQNVCPEFTPLYKIIAKPEEVEEAVKIFEKTGLQIAVKPQGLTGGKGVKVMCEHLKTYEECSQYAYHLLQTRPNEKVLLVEKLHGIEFTIMGITDGKHLVLCPASYDYPFRFEDDLGPGTGGMGSFVDTKKNLPFMDEKDLFDCRDIMQSIIDEMHRKNLLFNGILNGGFFKTSKGIKFMEFNSRFGDPEALVVLPVLKSPLAGLIKTLWKKNLTDTSITFTSQACVVKYLVAEEYPGTSNQATVFTVNEAAIASMGVDLFFAACVKTGDHTYKTLKKSRVLAVGALAKTIEEASEKIDEAIEKHISGNVHYRRDVGSKKSVIKLADTAKYK